MKELLLTVSFLFAIVSQAQETFNRAYHAINEQPSPFIVSINNNVYFTTQTYDPQFFGQVNLYKHTSSGTLSFKVPVSTVDPNIAFKSLDNHLLIAGGGLGCDIVTDDQINYVSKIDATNGTSIFTSTYTVVQGDLPKACLQHSDSSYYSFTDSCMFKHTKNGQFISKINLGLTEISSALLSQNNTIYISAKQTGTPKIIEISPAGALVSSSPMTVLFGKLTFYSGSSLLGLGLDGKLYKVSPSLGIIATSSTTNIFISDFVCQQDTIFGICSSSAFSSNYVVMDTLLNLVSLTSTTTHSITQSAICLNGNRVAILSKGVSKSSNSFPEHYFASLNVISKTSSNNFISDLALLSVTADSVKALCNANYCTTNLKARIKVRNVGTKPITEFKLNSFESPAIACGGFFYQEKFSGFVLQPGDSMTLSCTNYAAKGYVSGGALTTFSAQYCFYTTLPNGETDKTFEDNQRCETFNFMATGLSENSENNVLLNVGPNPFESKLTLSADVIIKRVQLFNSRGMLVINEVVNNKHVIISNSDLVRGIYFLKIETEKGIAVKKVLKQ